jgi:hypothetical protein
VRDEVMIQFITNTSNNATIPAYNSFHCTTMDSARQVLKEVFGFPSFRLSQEAVRLVPFDRRTSFIYVFSIGHLSAAREERKCSSGVSYRRCLLSLTTVPNISLPLFRGQKSYIPSSCIVFRCETNLMFAKIVREELNNF